MQSFLSRVISEVLKKSEGKVQNKIFVLPSQRACVFLKNELTEQLSKASFLPKIISIENFVQEIATISQIDSVQLLFEFYSVYKSQTAENDLESFDTFTQWASIVLQDFNEVDRHLVDSKDLFVYLRDINRLNNWSPNTELSKNYFRFFEKLHIYYEAFYEYLVSKKIGYQGLIYREAEGNMQHYMKTNQGKEIVLVGFNALNRAEEHIFQELLQNGFASIYWDADESYMSGTTETGVFLRKYKREWAYFQKNPFNWVENHLNGEEKSINIIGAPKNVSQLKYVGELLDKQESFQKMAVVLADESLLSLALNSLPRKVDKINITMGFSLQEIPLSNLFNNIFKLYLNQEKLGLVEKKLFYFKDVINVMNHPSFVMLSPTTFDVNSILGKSNFIFLSLKQLNKLFGVEKEQLEIITVLFGIEKYEPEELIKVFIKIIQWIKLKVVGVEKEQVYRFYTVFQQLQVLNEKFGHLKSIKALYQFFNQLVRNEKLSFQGEPLQGLQLMGMLETRAIDFENVIITSMNEGVLPASKSDNSFIPLDVKNHFGLPTYREKDAIFSYHFYRLMHRAKNIYFIYNTERDVFGTGEKSRFLTQLEVNRKDVVHTVLVANIEMNPTELKVIPKSESLLKSLEELARKGVSPSSLATYINNPVDFYYQKILKIREVDEVEETVAVNTMGTVIHETLEQLYAPYIGKHLTKDILKKMITQSEELIVSNFQIVYVNGDISKGKNKLIFEVSKKYLNRFLRLELEEIIKGKEIKIIALEQKLSSQLEIEGLNFPVTIRGIVDRIDTVDGRLRILDYKTGMVKESDLRMPDFSVMKEGYKYTKALQVMLYVHLYRSNTNVDVSNVMEAGIISFKNLNRGFLKMNFGEGYKRDYEISNERMEDFISELKLILKEIFNSEIPFQENPDKAF